METVWLEWHGPFLVSELDQYDNENLQARAGIYMLLDSEQEAEFGVSIKGFSMSEESTGDHSRRG